MSEYNQLTGSDCTTSIDRSSTDDISSPRSTKSRTSQFISSGSSVSSKLSRRSQFKKKSDLGVPLTLSMEDEVNDGSESQWVGNGGGGEETVSSPSNAAPNGLAFADDDPFYIFRGDLMKKLSSVESELEKYLDVVRNTVSGLRLIGVEGDLILACNCCNWTIFNNMSCVSTNSA